MLISYFVTEVSAKRMSKDFMKKIYNRCSTDLVDLHDNFIVV